MMEELNIALAAMGFVVVVVGLFSKPIKKSLLQEPAIAVLAGVAIGPYGLHWLDVDCGPARLEFGWAAAAVGLWLECHSGSWSQAVPQQRTAMRE